MLEQRQVQTQMMTLNQRQALEVLAMNTMELREFLEQEQLENPLLEVDFAPGQGDLVDIAQWLQGSQPQVEDGVYREEEPFPRREPAAGEERTYREDLKEQLYSLGVGAGRLELAERLGEDGKRAAVQALEQFSAFFTPDHIRAFWSACPLSPAAQAAVDAVLKS